jgi:MoaA/NifB/PqqE/SkfB family radical SAM enzyme
MINIFEETKFLFNKGPFHLLFYPTSRCNLYCEHCFNHNRQDNVDGTTGKKDELTIEEIGKIASKMGHLKTLTITGGEPFLRNDIVDIVGEFYRKNGLQYASIHTNGMFKERAVSAISDCLEKYPKLNIIFCTSIDGQEEEHNKFRDSKNSFTLAVDTVKEIESIKRERYPDRLFLLSSTMFSAATQEKFIETIDYIGSNFDYLNAKSCFIRGDSRDEGEKAVDPNMYVNYINHAEENIDRTVSQFAPMALKETLEAMTPRVVLNNDRLKTQTVPCQAGRKMAVLYENGDLHPCELLPPEQKFGNIRDVDYDINRLLFSDKGTAIKNRINPGNQCHCTWENAINVSLLFDVRSYPRILWTWFKLFVLGKGSKSSAVRNGCPPKSCQSVSP